jgi:hypothetical protein
VIRLSGRAMLGLDEFMLRTGHLKVVANVATEMGGVRHRVERAVAETLTCLTDVPSSQLAQLSAYLTLKNLCPVRNGHQQNEKSHYRYPNLVLVQTDSGFLVQSVAKAEPVRVWWQDLCLSDPRLPSMVGNVTASAKFGSKTGLSHVFDWAENLGLLSTSGQSTPLARVLVKLEGRTKGMQWLENPYVLDIDRIALGLVLIPADLDIFSRFVLQLANATFPLKKRSAARLFASTIAALVEEADHASYLGPRQRFHLADLLRDLKRSARRRDEQLGDTSISWHRAASRLETYVDLGLLAKDSRSPAEKYEYVYYPTPLLTEASRSLQQFSDPDEWVDTQLTQTLWGRSTTSAPLDLDYVETLLPLVLEAIHAPGTALPIDCIAVGLIQLAVREGHFLSFAAARSTVEELARKRSDIARLARGSRGERAEFVTIDRRRFS